MLVSSIPTTKSASRSRCAASIRPTPFYSASRTPPSILQIRWNSSETKAAEEKVHTEENISAEEAARSKWEVLTKEEPVHLPKPTYDRDFISKYTKKSQDLMYNPKDVTNLMKDEDGSTTPLKDAEAINQSNSAIPFGTKGVEGQKEKKEPVLGYQNGKRSKRHFMLENIRNPPSENIYIGNLFYDLTAEDLRTHMEQFGTVMHTSIVHDNRGISKGFGYVQFSTIESATKAISEFNQKVLGGRQVVLDYARNFIQPSPIDSEPSDTLYVGGMAYELSDRDIQALFADVPNVVDVRIAVDRRTGIPRGFAHAEFDTKDSAAFGMMILKQKTPYGRPMKVSFASQKSVGWRAWNRGVESSEHS